MTRILSVASECAPLIKTGGLADVVGALPAALASQGCEMRTLLPGYRAVMAQMAGAEELARFDDLFGGPARLLGGRVGTLDLMVIEAAHLYDREGGPYLDPQGQDWADNPERFAALCWAAAHVATKGAGDWRPDVVHGHDWQAGFTPEYLLAMGAKVPFVMTIHNVAFHGIVDPDRIDSLSLDGGRFRQEHFEYWGRVSALKAGLTGADRITTVSRTYAQELLTEHFGMGMEGILRARKGVLSGIVNGIDTDTWNPATDPALVKPFTTPRGKPANTAALREEFGLPADGQGPLCVLVSRLSDQKGIDMLIEALPALLDRGGQLALLGSGDPHLESLLKDYAATHPSVAVKIGYDEALSHRMMAGGEAILVPSRFEPCGLTQLYGLRYGTVPLVALTGGLADTVINASPAALAQGVATGVQFFPIDALSLGNALAQLCDLYADPKVWATLQRNGMKQPVGWETSAAAYGALYADVVAG